MQSDEPAVGWWPERMLWWTVDGQRRVSDDCKLLSQPADWLVAPTTEDNGSLSLLRRTAIEQYGGSGDCLRGGVQFENRYKKQLHANQQASLTRRTTHFTS